LVLPKATEVARTREGWAVRQLEQSMTGSSPN